MALPIMFASINLHTPLAEPPVNVCHIMPERDGILVEKTKYMFIYVIWKEVAGIQIL